MQSVEIRYLDIIWGSDQSVLKVEESGQAIELERVDQHWKGNSVTYLQKYFYIGLRVDDTLQYEPYLKLMNDKVAPLMPIKVPGVDKTWWIQKGDWDNKRQKYLSTIYRTAGRIELSVQYETVMLENHTVNFSVPDLEYYLSDLKGKLWMLMLDDKSASKVSIQNETPSVFSNNVFRLFSDLVSSYEAIVKKPHVTLSEIQEKLPKRLVKPVTRTFREISTQSSPRLLTSRSYEESYNNSENRYIHHLAFRTKYLLDVLFRLATYQFNALSDKVERDKHWLHGESGRRTKIIDPIVFDNEIQAITLDFEKQRKMLDEAAQIEVVSDGSPNLVDLSCTVSLGNQYGNSYTEYFIESLSGQDYEYKDISYLVFSSRINFREIFSTENLKSYVFLITGSGIESREQSRTGKIYTKLCFKRIYAIDIIQSPLKSELARLISTRNKLEKDGWVKRLGHDELDVIGNQVQITRTKLDLIERSLNHLNEFSSHIPALISRVKKVIQFFRIHKVGMHQEMPNSMVFLQNPLYASAKSIYQKVSNIEGVDDSLLNSMMAVDEIGLVNLPNLYERWCLLQLIFVITDIYRFQPQQGDWQQKLIDAVLKNEKDIEVRFSCEARQLDLKLTYEKELDSGKRPDYVIDLYYKTYVSNFERNAFSGEQKEPTQWYIDDEVIQRMVLDAKFRGNVTEKHINDLVEELYEGKNYSENDTNAVFVIHPVSKITKEKTSPLDWGNYCNYGQAGEIDHKKGALYLSPSREHRNSLDNLQRLIGMFLQSHTVILDDNIRRNVIWHNKCCISCGGNDLSIKLGITKGGNNVNKIHCKSCRQITIETQCVCCGRPLFKNGINWTYHRTRAEQATNVVCPKCETFL